MNAAASPHARQSRRHPDLAGPGRCAACVASAVLDSGLRRPRCCLRASISATGRKPLPNRWLLIAVALVCVAGVAFSYRTLYGRDVGVALLTVMLALKLMEMSAARDAMVVILLAYFLVITNFLYSQTIPTALYMLLVVWLITATMIGLQHQAQRPGRRAMLRQSALLMICRPFP